jgi:hypothetical protein
MRRRDVLLGVAATAAGGGVSDFEKEYLLLRMAASGHEPLESLGRANDGLGSKAGDVL